MFFHDILIRTTWYFSQISTSIPKSGPFLSSRISKKPIQKHEKTKIFEKQKFCHAFRSIPSRSPNMKSWGRFSSDISRKIKPLQPPKNHNWSYIGEHLLMVFPLEICDKKPWISEISKIHPTLRSCISELNKYFFIGPVPLERSMHKL